MSARTDIEVLNYSPTGVLVYRRNLLKGSVDKHEGQFIARDALIRRIGVFGTLTEAVVAVAG